MSHRANSFHIFDDYYIRGLLIETPGSFLKNIISSFFSALRKYCSYPTMTALFFWKGLKYHLWLEIFFSWLLKHRFLCSSLTLCSHNGWISQRPLIFPFCHLKKKKLAELFCAHSGCFRISSQGHFEGRKVFKMTFQKDNCNSGTWELIHHVVSVYPNMCHADKQWYSDWFTDM